MYEIYIYIYGIVFFLDICMPLLESMLLSVFANPSKLDLPTLRKGSRERKNATEQIKNMTLARHSFIYINICKKYIYIYIKYICLAVKI